MTLEISLFAAVECCLEQLPEPGTVVMHSGRQGGTPTLDFACEVGEGVVLPSPGDAAGWSRLVDVLGLLDATVETESVPCHFRVRFSGDGEG